MAKIIFSRSITAKGMIIIFISIIGHNIFDEQDFTDIKYEQYNPKVGFILDSDVFDFDLNIRVLTVQCSSDVTKGASANEKTFFLQKRRCLDDVLKNFNIKNNKPYPCTEILVDF